MLNSQLFQCHAFIHIFPSTLGSAIPSTIPVPLAALRSRVCCSQWRPQECGSPWIPGMCQTPSSGQLQTAALGLCPEPKEEAKSRGHNPCWGTGKAGDAKDTDGEGELEGKWWRYWQGGRNTYRKWQPWLKRQLREKLSLEKPCGLSLYSPLPVLECGHVLFRTEANWPYTGNARPSCSHRPPSEMTFQRSLKKKEPKRSRFCFSFSFLFFFFLLSSSIF